MRTTMLTLVTLGAVLMPATGRADDFTFRIGFGGPRGYIDFELGRERRMHAPPPPRCEPVRRHEPVRVWVPGHYEERTTYVEIPGRWHEEWVPEEVRTVRIGHLMYREVVRPGHMRRVWEPARMVPQTCRVWVPGCWRYER